MSHRQEEGQDDISWREELRNLADGADIKAMDTPDLLCVIYVTGIRDNDLREKLLKVQNPTLQKFDRVVSTFDQAKTQLSEIKPTAQASQAFSQRGKPKQRTTQSCISEQRTRREASGQRSSYQPSREEQLRRESCMVNASAAANLTMCCRTARAQPTYHVEHVERKGTPNWHAQEPLLTTQHPNRGKTKGSCQVN